MKERVLWSAPCSFDDCESQFRSCAVAFGYSAGSSAVVTRDLDLRLDKSFMPLSLVHTFLGLVLLVGSLFAGKV
jgi:hypothetical protein